MNLFEQRRVRKIIKHALHDARHSRHMREDIAPAADLTGLQQAEKAVEVAWDRRDPAAIEEALDQLSRKLERVSPPRPHPKIRENVEIFAVAVAVAMGFRTYFIQPFKIPTGSMQPTLHGIVVEPEARKEFMDYFPMNVVRLVVFGERYVEVRAKAAGTISLQGRTEDSSIFNIEGVRHRVRNGMHFYPLVTPYVQKGQLLASGRIRQGDHIFVNKVIYNIRRPKRGDIFVFDTKGIDYPGVRRDTFYIKRLVGLPGEQVSLDPPYLLINGRRVTEPYPFQRLVNEPDKGYAGYIWPEAPIGGYTAVSRIGPLQLTPTQYLPMGDNTRSSLDGRYFGAVERDRVVGPAFMVYWPFGLRWGRVQ